MEYRLQVGKIVKTLSYLLLVLVPLLWGLASLISHQVDQYSVLIFAIIWAVGVWMVLIPAIRVMYQVWDHERDLRILCSEGKSEFHDLNRQTISFTIDDVLQCSRVSPFSFALFSFLPSHHIIELRDGTFIIVSELTIQSIAVLGIDAKEVVQHDVELPLIRKSIKSPGQNSN